MQNFNRGNYGPRHQQPSASKPPFTLPKDLPDKSKSKNPWINGTRTYNYQKDGGLCVKCGHLGHIPRDCKEDVLPAWEQSYLKTIVFGDYTPQANFAAASYGSYDGNILPYGTSRSMDMSRSSSSGSATPSSSNAFTIAASSSNSFGVGYPMSLSPSMEKVPGLTRDPFLTPCCRSLNLGNRISNSSRFSSELI